MSRIPYGTRAEGLLVGGCAVVVAVVTMQLITSAAGRLGKAFLISSTAPDTKGVAMEVPDISPVAHTSVNRRSPVSTS
jgi:hypothetical protein